VKPRELRYALFDLDDTMYPESAGVMAIVSQRINEYMALRLHMDEATIQELRPHYWKQYGTTMRGLLVEFRIDPDDYLSYVHDFSVAGLLAPNEQLNGVLADLPWHKVVFTNGAKQHAQQVLAALGVGEHFTRIFDITDTGYVGKPDPSAYQCVLNSLGVGAEDCIALDDSIANLRTAKELSMITVLVGSAEKVDGVDFAIARIEEAAEVARQVQTKHCG
jgi:putative hydrolase of the HAD superfamily